MGRRPSKSVLTHLKLEAYLASLPPDDDRLAMVENMYDCLMENMFAGSKVSKRLTPRLFVEDYHLNPKSPNIYVFDHPQWFRSCYAIGPDPHNPGHPCPIILNIMDHDEYNALFGYNKK